MIFKTFVHAVAILVPCLQAFSKLANDSQIHFAKEFYPWNQFAIDSNFEHNIMVSPTGVQKFLAVIYEGTRPDHADSILFDLGLKHIFWTNKLVDEELRTAQLREKLLANLTDQSLDKDVLNVFEKDFKDDGNSIVVKNCILIPAYLTPKPEFIEFAEKYFNFKIDWKSTNVRGENKTDIDVKNDDDETNIELMSNISIKAKLEKSHQLEDGNIHAAVEASYFEKDYGKYVELPLENNLTLFLAFPAKESEFFVTHNIVQDIANYSDFKEILPKETILAILPPMKFGFINDLAFYFNNIFIKGSEGVKTILKDASMIEVFSNWPQKGLRVGSFLQHLEFELQSDQHFDNTIRSPARILNATAQPFFFVVKKEKAFYLIGYYKDFHCNG